MHKYIMGTAMAAVAFLSFCASARAGHVYAGIIDTNGIAGLGAGDALSFVVNTTGQVYQSSSLATQTMSVAVSGAQAGLYLTNAISFTGLSNGRNWTGSGYRTANSYAALSGSYIVMEIAGITGAPNGAKFSFWDEAVSTTAPTSTYTVGSGLTGAPYINLTDTTLIVGDGVNDGVGEPPTTVQGTTGVDPYGHIHGRSFTVDTPGTYTVSYILKDLNGIQADSTPFTVTYSAVPEPATIGLIIGAGALAAFFHRRRKLVR